MLDRASRLANGLAARGIKPQDRIAVLADNIFETVEINCACALGNTPIATLYTYYSIETKLYLLDRIGASVLIVDAEHLAQVQSRLHELPDLKVVLVVGDAQVDNLERYDDLLAGADPTVHAVAAAPEDVHIIRFSSGTTGNPKASSTTCATGWLTTASGAGAPPS